MHVPAPKELKELVARYAANRDDFRRGTFNETQTRIELIDPLFDLIGWDMANRNGYSEEYREVIHEDRVRVEGKSKAPDYAFRIGGSRKFQLEAKKPAINIGTDAAAAFQIRRYAWSASLSLCVLTNFENLAIYDAASRPAKTDTARKARAALFNERRSTSRLCFAISIASVRRHSSISSKNSLSIVVLPRRVPAPAANLAKLPFWIQIGRAHV